MSSLEKIKDLIHNKFSDGRDRMSAIINNNSETWPSKGILLFYVNDDVENLESIIALGQFTRIGLYNQEIQIAIIHDDYNRARDIAFQTLKYISTNKITGIRMIPQGIPSYAGINGQRGAHVFTINYLMKGGQ